MRTLRPLPDTIARQTIFIGRRIYIRRRCLYIRRAMRVHSSPDEYTFPRRAVMNAEHGLRFHLIYYLIFNYIKIKKGGGNMMDYHFLLLPLHPTLYLTCHIISCISREELPAHSSNRPVLPYLCPPHPGTIRERIG